ncbi:hypothetical protein P8452_35256 [Trifolium repens]|nr:hypothetical protein P8452_35256 [Trifolium repens]
MAMGRLISLSSLLLSNPKHHTNNPAHPPAPLPPPHTSHHQNLRFLFTKSFTMTLSHLFKFANRLTLSTLRNQEGRISSASYRASRISKIGSNKQHQEFSYEIASVSLITFPLLASSLMLLHLSSEKDHYEMFQSIHRSPYTHSSPAARKLYRAQRNKFFRDFYEQRQLNREQKG